MINKYVNKKNEKFDNPILNTHQYHEDKEYIHFFRYNEFATYYFNLGKDGSYEKENDNYILFMTANIPDFILEKYSGFGLYELNGEQFPIPEYAIPMGEFSFEYIVDITNHPMSFYVRENEDEEYRKYLELIKRLKYSNRNMKEIFAVLLNMDFEMVLGIRVDKRSEEELKKYIDGLLSQVTFSKSKDISIQEFRR